jgi:DNA-directed RNA polymerase subunit RPC12/RpoP
LTGTEKMEKEKNNTPSGRQPLPIVAYGGKHFFTVDLKNKRFVPWIAEEPTSIPFESEGGKEMCSSLGVITCKKCGMSVFIQKAYEGKELRCMHCFSKELMPLYEGCKDDN